MKPIKLANPRADIRHYVYEWSRTVDLVVETDLANRREVPAGSDWDETTAASLYWNGSRLFEELRAGSFGPVHPSRVFLIESYKVAPGLANRRGFAIESYDEMPAPVSEQLIWYNGQPELRSMVIELADTFDPRYLSDPKLTPWKEEAGNPIHQFQQPPETLLQMSCAYCSTIDRCCRPHLWETSLGYRCQCEHNSMSGPFAPTVDGAVSAWAEMQAVMKRGQNQ